MKRWILTPIIFSTSILPSCYRDSCKEDVQSYLQNKIADIIHLENMAKNAFERVLQDSYTTDQELYNTMLYDVIPVYYEFYKKLASIKIDSPVLQKIHEDCLNGVNIQYQAFLRIVEALEDMDHNQMAEANSLLFDACKLMVCPYI